MTFHRRGVMAAAIALAFATGTAHAVLERVGPVGTSPSQGGYPAWYQDRTGLVLEFCDPKNQAEVDGGWCLLLPPDVPNVPETFPTSFFDEHFYFAADAGMTTRQGSRALLVLAVEAAFAADVAPGGQMTFSRIRVRLDNVPVSGTYRFIHPYGEEILPAIAGEKIFFTDDVGITCPPGSFDCAMGSRLGPFLLPSDQPGGVEQPPISGPVPGKLYIADPTRAGPVTGSPLPPFTDSTGTLRNHNIFRIEGPAGSGIGVDENGNVVDWIETTDFTLMGRLFQGSLPGRAEVQRAAYARSGGTTQVDVYATGSVTTQARLPAQPIQPAVSPQLSVFGAACNGTVDANGEIRPPYSAPAGVPEVQMLSSGSKHWAQLQPTTPPAKVCLKDSSARDATGQLVPTYAPYAVTDTVVVTDAYFDPATKTMSVSATSSDQAAPPTLALSFNEFRADMQGGQIQVSQLDAAPAKVQVFSSAGGMGEFPVRAGLAPVAAPVGPVAMNDSFAVDEDSPGVVLSLLANDTGAGGGTITLASAPRLGTATVNGDGTVTYRPNPNANGTDAFSYTVTANGMASNPANVMLTVNPVNDKPVAVNETANALVGVPMVIDVAANDTDADGNADIVAVDGLTAPVGNTGQLGATATANGRQITFIATAEGTYTFRYRPKDTAMTVSDNEGTVTVTVIAAEAVNVTRAEYITSKARLRVDGSIAPVINQKITVIFTDDAGVQKGDIIDTVVSDTLGAWVVDKPYPRLPSGATRVQATSENGTSQSRTLRFK